MKDPRERVLFSPTATAALLKLEYYTVKRMLKLGTLDHVRTSETRIMIPRSELIRLGGLDE